MSDLKVGDRVIIKGGGKRRPPPVGTVRKVWVDVYPEPETLPEGEPAEMPYAGVYWMEQGGEPWTGDEELHPHPQHTLERVDD